MLGLTFLSERSGSFEDILEVDFSNGKITPAGDQYGVLMAVEIRRSLRIGAFLHFFWHGVCLHSLPLAVQFFDSTRTTGSMFGLRSDPVEDLRRNAQSKTRVLTARIARFPTAANTE